MTFAIPPEVEPGDRLTASLWNSNIKPNLDALYPLGDSLSTFTPVLEQIISISITVGFSQYLHVGRMCFWNFRIDATSAGSPGSQIFMTIPVPAWSGLAVFMPIGFAQFRDADAGSGRATDNCTISIMDANRNRVQFQNERTEGNVLGAVPSFAVASGDFIRGWACYPTETLA